MFVNNALQTEHNFISRHNLMTDGVSCLPYFNKNVRGCYWWIELS